MVLERLYTYITVNVVFCTEINRVRNELFHGVVKNAEVDGMFTELQLPTPSGPRVKLSEKVYAPVKEYPKVRLPAYMYQHGNWMITKLASKWVCLICNVVTELAFKYVIYKPFVKNLRSKQDKQDYSPLHCRATNSQTNSHNFRTLN